MAGNTMYAVCALPVLQLKADSAVYVRVYPWYGSEAAGKTLCLSNVYIHGVEGVVSSQDEGTPMIVWPFTQGTDGQLATYASSDIANSFQKSNVALTSGLAYAGAAVWSGKSGKGTFTKISSTSTIATDGQQCISFTLTPAPGVTFNPAKVSFKAMRVGTDGGLLKVVCGSGTNMLTLATSEAPARSGASNDLSVFYYDLSGVTATEGRPLKLNIYLSSIMAGKAIGLSDISVEGDLSGSTYPVESDIPQHRTFDAIVDQSLSATVAATSSSIGQYKTIQEALNAAPDDASADKPWLIFIKNGYYNDLNHLTMSGKYTYLSDGSVSAAQDASAGSRIVVVSKPNIHLIGEDVNKVILAQDRIEGGYAADKSKPWYNVAAGATLVVSANDFYCENLTIDNEWWTKDSVAGPQALALYAESDRAIFNNCRIRSYQDTYLSSKTKNINTANGVNHWYDRQFVNNSLLEGAVDYIYGGGDVFFEGCKLNIVRKTGGFIVAPCHYDSTRWGYVFNNSTITASGTPSDTRIWLGRPWHGAPKTVFLHTQCEVSTYDSLWYATMGGLPAVWAAYDMWDATGKQMNTTSRRYYYYTSNGTTYSAIAKNALSDAEVNKYTIENVFSGDKSEKVTGYWNPIPSVTKAATPVVCAKGTTVTWTTDDYAICYVVFVNGRAAAFTTGNTYTVSEGDSVSVRSANAAGALSFASNTVVAGSTGLKQTATSFQSSAVAIGEKGKIHIVGVTVPSDIRIYGIDGLILQNLSVGHNVSVDMAAGVYVVSINGKSQKVIVM